MNAKTNFEAEDAEDTAHQLARLLGLIAPVLSKFPPHTETGCTAALAELETMQDALFNIDDCDTADLLTSYMNGLRDFLVN